METHGNNSNGTTSMKGVGKKPKEPAKRKGEHDRNERDLENNGKDTKIKFKE